MEINKIEEAAYRFATSQTYGELLALINGYKEGYKDAINKFQIDLWHPASEVPEIERVIIMENYYPDGRIMFISHMRKSTFHNPIEDNTQKWLYVDDLLPKKGGQQ